MAELGAGPHRSSDITKQLGREVQSLSPTRSNLIRKLMLCSPAPGDTTFTATLFDQHLKRMMGCAG